MILDRLMASSFSKHLASNLGKVKKLFQKSQESLPIHQASANGDKERVKTLLMANPDVCLELDQHERIPLHLAACNGQVEIIEVLLNARPGSTSVRDEGEPNPHQLVTNQLKAKDRDGNTALHFAVDKRNIEIISLLVNCPDLDVNALNNNGATALDLLLQSPRYPESDFEEIRRILEDAEAVKASDLSPRQEKLVKYILAATLTIVALTFGAVLAFGPPGNLSLAAITFEDARNPHNVNRTFHTGADHEGNITWTFCTSGPYFKASVTVGFLSSISIVGIVIILKPKMRVLKEMLVIAISSLIVVFSCYTAWHHFEQVAVFLWFVSMLLFLVSSLALPFGKWLFKKCGVICWRNND